MDKAPSCHEACSETNFVKLSDGDKVEILGSGLLELGSEWSDGVMKQLFTI